MISRTIECLSVVIMQVVYKLYGLAELIAGKHVPSVNTGNKR